MNGFERRAQQKKETIMKTTLDMLKNTDPKKLRIADIAAAAGVSQVTIYNYFGSKEVLVRDVFFEYSRKVLKEFGEFMAGDHTLKEKVEFIVFQKKDMYRTFSRRFMEAMLLEDPEAARYIQEVYMPQGMEYLTQLIEDGKRKGEISETISTSTILMFIQVWSNQTEAILEYAERQGNDETLIEELVHLFFYGISVHS